MNTVAILFLCIALRLAVRLINELAGILKRLEGQP